MERDKKKKLYNLRVLATNIFMAISVVAIASILTLLAMGYSLNKDGDFEQSGLLQIKSFPSGATVEIDGKTQFYRTEMSKMLSEGSHEVIVTKSGYSTWGTTLNIEAGLLTRIDWVRLFPLQRTVEDVHTYPALRLVSASPDSYYMALLTEDSTNLQLINIRADSVKYSNIDLMTFLPKDVPSIETTDDFIPTGLEIIQWSENHNKFLLKWTFGKTVYWYLVDVTKPEDSVNLTAKFILDFTDLQIADAAATKIWALESGNLRLIHTDNTTISSVFVTNVEKFSAGTNAVAFIGTNSKNQRIVGLYQEGEKSTTIQEIASSISTCDVVYGNNWKNNWIAYTLDNRLFVRVDDHIIAENDLEFTPALLAASPTSRFAVASSDEQITTIDTELEKRYDYAFPGASINWLDNHILWTDQDNQLTIIDFNGENRRELTAIASGFDLALTRNNRWLYFIVPQPNDQPGYVLQRERL